MRYVAASFDQICPEGPTDTWTYSFTGWFIQPASLYLVFPYITFADRSLYVVLVVEGALARHMEQRKFRLDLSSIRLIGPFGLHKSALGMYSRTLRKTSKFFSFVYEFRIQ